MIIAFSLILIILPWFNVMTLVIAGFGIKFLSHLTWETDKILKNSDKVFYLANDKMYPEWVKSINKNTESLHAIYFSKSMRIDAYYLIKEKILAGLNNYNNVCFVIYGNPVFLVQVTSLIANAARMEGHTVHVLPAISSFDCLLADLNINPGEGGMQLFEARELLVYKKFIDISAHIVIFQPAAIGQDGHSRDRHQILKGLALLSDYLLTFYDASQEVIFYEASQYPTIKEKLFKTHLNMISQIEVSSKMTMYIKPAKKMDMCMDTVNKIKSIFADFDTPSEKSCF